MIPIGDTPAIVEKGGWVYLANMTKGMRALDLDPVSLILDNPGSIKLDAPMKGKALDNINIYYVLKPQDKDGFDPVSSTMSIIESHSGTVLFERQVPHTGGIYGIPFPAKDMGIVFDVEKRYIVKLHFDAKPEPVTATARIPLEWQAIAADLNRDGQIDQADLDKTKAGNKYYFWINDNVDKSDTDGNSIPGSGSSLAKMENGDANPDAKDCLKPNISGTRDLVDYFPVLLNIGDVIQKLPAAKYTYILKQGQSAVNYVSTDLMSGTIRDYLTDVATATALQNRAKTEVEETGTRLDSALLEKLLEDGEEQIILVDGRGKTRMPLVLEVRDNANKDVAFRTELPLSIDGVENMFRHKNLIREMAKIEASPFLGKSIGVTPIPEHDMPDVDRMGKLDRLVAADFKDSQDHFAGFSADKSGDFVHVHGYNVNEEDSRGEQAEVFKRLYWSGSNANFWGVTWYGWDSQRDYWLLKGLRSPNYHINVRHAFNAGKLLKHFVTNSSPSPVNATFSAHSLGNMVVSTAIQNGMPYRNYLMVNAAVAEEAYLDRANYVADNWDISTRPLMYNVDWRYPSGTENYYDPFLWQSEWYELFDAGDARSNLTWRNNFSSARKDNVYTFFAPTDEAFRPFKVTIEDLNKTPLQDVTAINPGDVYDGLKSKGSIMLDMLGKWVEHWFDSERLGTYGWSYNELLKGADTMTMPDSMYGGWGFNMDSSDGYRNGYCEGEGADRICSYIKPEQANMLVTNPEVLKTKPLFDKSNLENSSLFSSSHVGSSVLTTAMRERMLANEIPALTFAVGHRGVDGSRINNTDIRNKYLIEKNAPWPRGEDDYEWRHSDFVNVAYPYLFRLYDDFVQKSR